MSVDKLVDSTQLDSDLTSVANAIRTKGGTSAQLAFPAGFVSAINAIPSGGGGGLTTVATRTFTGAGVYEIAVSVGTKMPQTDFWFKLTAKSTTQFAYDANYKPAVMIGICFSDMCHFDLSTVGDSKQVISDQTFDVNGSFVSAGSYVGQMTTARNGGASNYGRMNNFKVNRKSDHFEVKIFNSNASYAYPSGAVYDWELVYFGSNAATDIVEIS